MNYLTKNFLKSEGIFLIPVLLIFGLLTRPLPAQVNESGMENEDSVQIDYNRNQELILQIYSLVEQYPKFSYRYIYDNQGKIENIVIKGIDNEGDAQKLKTWLVEVDENNQLAMNRIGPEGYYYVTEKAAEPKEGMEELYNELYASIEYPSEAEKRGVEGVIYVTFIVDTEGNVTNVSATANMEEGDENTYLVDVMKEEAVEAVKASSGEWNPATIGGVAVSQWKMLPVQFQWKQYPYLRAIF
ncbi:MAG: energy transducer TonB [Bacteroidia bacterium]|nr:energy transducer TonB [Bacteroidia bacterium]